MPPKASKTNSSVFVVINNSEIDSVHASDASATARSDALKRKENPSSIKVELHKVQDNADSAEKSEPAKVTAPAKKTKSPEDQRAANAEKPLKTDDADLPENIKALLNASGDVLSGKSIVVTGVPPTLQRKNAEKLVTNYGGKLVKSISKNTSFVVLGNDAGPKKLEQIEDLGIETLDEDAFVALLEAGGSSKRSADDDAKPAKRQKK